MNKSIISGRLTRDPEITYKQVNNENLCIARYTLAVNRIKNNEADFIDCVAFGKTAELAEKYYTRGIKLIILGRIQVDSYKDKDGNNRKATKIVVENAEFCESKGAGGGNQEQKQEQQQKTETIDSFNDSNSPFNY